jgi:S-sulfo-L-cysteine synthase (O-acetyl-L-serine-dependent)
LHYQYTLRNSMQLFELIGNTPIVEVVNLSPNPHVKIYAKLEGQNPGGSVKDRAAYGMIKGAIDRGDLKKGDKIVEATSGNTGIALAMVGQMLGIDVTLIMPDNSTIERVQTMEAYGSKVILTPAEKTIEYSRELAIEMADTGEYLILNQFDNSDNYTMHYKTTGPEIWRDTQGKITHFISSMGTTGTIMGVSRYLKEMNENIQIVGCQPVEGSSIPGIRRWTPEYLPKIYEASRVDRIYDVSAAEATIMTRQLALKEGIFAGMSSGGAMHAAVNIAAEIDHGILVSIVCDRGDRYLSSDLFASSKM